MNENEIKPIQIEFIRELCKGKLESELLEAEENFMEFMLVIKEICDRKEEITNNNLD